jgi:ParB family chromosome partitioning protein
MSSPTSTGCTIYQVPIDRIIIGTRYCKDLGDLDALAASIRDSPAGMMQPIILGSQSKDGLKLIAGQRRLEAAKLLGWKDVPAIIVKSFDDALAALIAERDENTCRKDFAPSEAVALGRAIEEREKEEAAQRQMASRAKKGQKIGAPKGSGGVATTLREGESPAKGKTRDKVGEVVGMSGRTYEKAKQVVEAAEEQPEKFRVVAEEMDRTGKVEPAHKEVTGKAAREREWKRRKGESVADWKKRLKAVPEADKKGHKRLFDGLSSIAYRDEFREQEREERTQKFKDEFDAVTESDVVFKWLAGRREKWPEKFRHQFIDLVRGQLKRLEVGDAVDRGTGPADPAPCVVGG